MLGKTAGGLYWMFRYLERSENTARLIDAGLRMALTRSNAAHDEWASVLETTGQRALYEENYDEVEGSSVVDFLLRDKSNSSSVISLIEQARNNARMVRTALTREVWEATNECWMILKEKLARPIRERDLPEVLGLIRRQSALVRGALHGTMLRNDIYDFARIGTFLERADNTARILDVKYYVLLPSVMHVGSKLDNVQWETILRSVSAQRAYRWLNKDDFSARGIVEFLVLDRRMPRSLGFCTKKLLDNLSFLAEEYGLELPCHLIAQEMVEEMDMNRTEDIFEVGLHEYIEAFLKKTNELSMQIEKDYRFYG